MACCLIAPRLGPMDLDVQERLLNLITNSLIHLHILQDFIYISLKKYEATKHYPNQWWPSSLTPYGVTIHNKLMLKRCMNINLISVSALWTFMRDKSLIQSGLNITSPNVTVHCMFHKKSEHKSDFELTKAPQMSYGWVVGENYYRVCYNWSILYIDSKYISELKMLKFHLNLLHTILVYKEPTAQGGFTEAKQ